MGGKNMWNHTEVTRRLSIQYPIIQAGMAGGITTPELVAAVSDAGGLGMIGAGYMTPEKLAADIQKIRELTSKPFGVNLFVPEHPAVIQEEIDRANQLLEPIRQMLGIAKKQEVPEIDTSVFDEMIQIVLKYEVPVCSFTFGIPGSEAIRQLKKRGIVTIGTATTVKEAVMNEEAGMDMVVVQGSEAGGHRGSFAEPFDQSMIGNLALIPQAADHVSIPIIAAGGIMDGRGVFASLILGAQAVQMGTAFVACKESGAHERHKQAILNASEEQAVITSAFSGKPARGLINEFILRMKGHEDALPAYPIQHMLTRDIRSEAAKQNKKEWMSLWCGQNPRLSKNVPAAELIETIARQVETIIHRFQT
ncbi:NAD(P)H-dependent flavin oxidoreductase [Caldibacillus debilis]|uniref:NAD(P)H-dependent flavin oxidoreductase n=1 Tax=Caldibacillus debilis TaxID=301148 RepID=UPI0023F0B13C|nr:nitronate monooxygenase [Caldibacillus debilis]